MSATNGRLIPLIDPDRASSNNSASRPVASCSSIQLIRGTRDPPINGVQGRRKLNPVSILTRTPDFEGTTATLIGTFRTPARNVLPAASASATPTGVIFGPTPNSVPSCVRTPTSQLRLGNTSPCSIPPKSTTASVSAATPLPPL